MYASVCINRTGLSLLDAFLGGVRNVISKTGHMYNTFRDTLPPFRRGTLHIDIMIPSSRTHSPYNHALKLLHLP